ARLVARSPSSIGPVPDLKGRHFTNVADWSGEELLAVLDLADDLKARQHRREEHHLLPGRALGMIFQKPSTRTRVSFEVGFAQLEGVRLAYLGDGNNVCASLMVAAAKLGMPFVAATPEGYEPDPKAVEIARKAGGEPELVHDPQQAAHGADVLYTDVWTSMGQEDERDRRLRDLAGFGIDEQLVRLAGEKAIVLHCLPAHYGEEITEGVLYGPQSAVWDQAESRLHAQKGLLALVMP